MNISVNININAAPELIGVLQSLAAALTGAKQFQVETAATTPQSVQTSPAPVPPASVPTAPTPAPVQTAAPITTATPAPAAVPTTAQTYTMDQLAVAATQLVDAGRRDELVQLLQQFGVQALTALPKEQYGAFATQLRQMGAKI